jgi:predicted component of viral defense system (DUF524 family)
MRFWGDLQELGTVRFEVRSRKLGYLTDYRWMLRDISEVASSLALEQFAVAAGRYKADEVIDAQTAYERFCFLKSLLTDSRFVAATQEIISHPHHSWEEEPEVRSPGRGASRLYGGLAQLTRPGQRVRWPVSNVSGLGTLPREIRVVTGASTFDTPPNRFVKFALEQWIGTVVRLQDSIRGQQDKPARDRGLRETEETLRDLEEIRSAPLFREVTALDQLPSSNQVLQRREGYREVAEAYWQSEAAAQLCWSGGEDVYGAGQRDVATLYEFWCFIQVLEAVKSLCTELDLRPLLRETEEEVDLVLRAGRETVVSGIAERLGRRIKVSLSYNRSFTIASADQSWTKPMKPDCSIRLEAVDAIAGSPDVVWVHFDAKYRADRLVELFGDDNADESTDRSSEKATAKRADLLKMHAYRDAIRRTAGSYVLYPGLPGRDAQTKAYSEYHEILPGLGAFLLRPGEDGEADGSQALTDFLADLFDHFASIPSQDRRNRYWQNRSFQEAMIPGRSGWAPDLDSPPADTPVLLGYVKSQSHLDWIHAQARYNLRLGDRRGAVGMDGPETGAKVLVLYGDCLSDPEVWRLSGPPELWVRDQMSETNYPMPRGPYLCLDLDHEVVGPPGSMPKMPRVRGVASLRQGGRPAGSPVVVSWADISG